MRIITIHENPDVRCHNHRGKTEMHDRLPSDLGLPQIPDSDSISKALGDSDRGADIYSK
jgi:hypothetical protein